MSHASLLIWISPTGSFLVSLELVLYGEIESDFLLLHQTVVVLDVVIRIRVQTKVSSTLILILLFIVRLATIAMVIIFISWVSHDAFIDMDCVLKGRTTFLLTKSAQLETDIVVLVVDSGASIVIDWLVEFSFSHTVYTVVIIALRLILCHNVISLHFFLPRLLRWNLLILLPALSLIIIAARVIRKSPLISRTIVLHHLSAFGRLLFVARGIIHIVVGVDDVGAWLLWDIARGVGEGSTCVASTTTW